jgi:hypothetical protein
MRSAKSDYSLGSRFVLSNSLVRTLIGFQFVEDVGACAGHGCRRWGSPFLVKEFISAGHRADALPRLWCSAGRHEAGPRCASNSIDSCDSRTRLTKRCDLRVVETGRNDYEKCTNHNSDEEAMYPFHGRVIAIQLSTFNVQTFRQRLECDAANDLALLKAEGKFTPLPVAASRAVRLGNTVATVGFPNIGLQGFAPKLAKGEIAALSGPQDDARYFQISVPVQSGNSGGALVDERGNVVGVVSAKLNAAAALSVSGALPENVNYAVKSSFLLSFLESVPEISAKLKEARTAERKFEEVVKDAEQAAVLVLVY